MHRLPLRHAFAVAAIVALACMSAGTAPIAFARSHAAERDEIVVASLPREARDVLALIHAGGPFRFERDGVTFGNRERSLPPRPRGARRIVCGGPRRTPEVCYYSDDHYATFRRIRE